eukprot:jgi/Botrbrau1/20138/Bobra.0173s0040.1
MVATLPLARPTPEVSGRLERRVHLSPFPVSFPPLRVSYLVGYLGWPAFLISASVCCGHLIMPSWLDRCNSLQAQSERTPAGKLHKDSCWI